MAEAQAVQTRRSATERLFSGCWQATSGTKRKPSHAEALTAALTMLADSLDRDLPKGDGLKVHLAVLEGMTEEECIRAISRSAEQSSFFPTPHELRRLSGRTEVSDPATAEAMTELQRLLVCMRRWGPELKPIPGKIIRDRDADGLVLLKPEREPEVPCPDPPLRVKRAIVAMGMGSFEAGLQAIARHPSVSRDAESLPWAGKTAQDIEQRWIRSFLNAREQ